MTTVDTAISGRVAVFCFSSAGELDVILPILVTRPISEFSVVVFKMDILEKIRRDSFYGKLLEGRLESRAAETISSSILMRWLRFSLNAIRVFWKFRNHDRFFAEYGRSGREKNILLLLLAYTGRGSRIFFYPHGHAVTADDAYAPDRWPVSTRVCMRSGARILKLGNSAPRWGLAAIEYPILYPAWRRLVAESVPQLYEDHVVILSRDAHPDYLLEENRLQMFADAIEVFTRFFPGSRIVVKAHPREFFASTTLQIGGRDVEVSYENTYSVVRGARLAVSFWTSAFFQCMALGVPVVEYHIPHARFRALYPSGSLNAAFVRSFTTKAELFDYVAALSGGARQN